MEYPELGPVLEAILKTVPATKVILFGSRARKEAGPESDYDLLVVVPAPYKTLATWKRLYEEVGRVQGGLALDLLLASEEDLARPGAWMTVYPAALREGKVLYAA
ncbi:nucleotidyltransferase family protein [Thermus filiformis]|uniref:Nucleotidyltransferase n=1 Tax=Thermus filiformis TaxID=276 RepID=A0A0D6X9H3_THEFI|nr:nucleotidyltransferase domain-containing protein [Thermus filiformis]KIX84342.1 nucleotidyltransferase [Thermus filiformis]